ncbi:2-oxoglutarate dehydrogenase complex dihydrolipoyllysine-residue succinyltransferase [Deinococcus peraridilitoris]|uniref:Dihydrolipoyllysine-residue succinyltransferase component of 2-oxoglutarate dehydrogenase complex n=1 Tax=Deinococcus peraridilitoris (strain DSM 19664 / LMG 22246 / CIP 109416 / KR-200) TaxID=937777 RepID=K9ZXU2_DEIPD|nr:2-oxoglutarate dehydrogenase complex dihydrolipoyllysine-residue succinyltransferase [Deinococcus peraridilitoris]AFZ66483.1 2-oxoglutarate dehydrogenase complex dihydrolipoamide succinyltransferase [Deinococcus peraridilitoris DSM 19664]
MADIKVPVFSESISEGTLLSWHKKPGDTVKRGEVVAEIETDKVVLEVTALQDGVLQSVARNEGDTVLSEEVLGTIGEGGAASSPAASAPAPQANVQTPSAAAAVAEKPAVATDDLSPAVRKLVIEGGLDPAQLQGTGKDGRITKGDVLAHGQAGPSATAPAQSVPAAGTQTVSAPLPGGARPEHEVPRREHEVPRREQRVPMTRIRARIAERLKEVQNTAAILTTFNEVNMKPAMDLRKKYQDAFVAKHGVKLGFMSLFVRAATEALKQFPVVNASLEGKDVIYHGYYDIGIAVASERGLVVPILRDTDSMSLAGIEKQIADFAGKARNGKLTLEDMTGGTFSITNGGTFGSMMSTPILNQPQSAILGMHNIIERPIVENGQIVARPMMYLALSYDHRIIDGREAVLFLVTIKNILEDPARLLLDL